MFDYLSYGIQNKIKCNLILNIIRTVFSNELRYYLTFQEKLPNVSVCKRNYIKFTHPGMPPDSM